MSNKQGARSKEQGSKAQGSKAVKLQDHKATKSYAPDLRVMYL